MAKVLTQENKILDTKHVQFLEFSSKKTNGELSIDVDEDTQESEVDAEEVACELNPGGDDESGEVEFDNISSVSADDNEEITESLVPKIAPSRVLRDRNSKVKPIKYTYLTTDPTSFKKAIECRDGKLWKTAADEEIARIEHHKVWEDAFQHPTSFLWTTWVFRTKPATASAIERKKARLCIQGFSQVPGVDYGDTFAPTGKYTSLLILLMFAIDKRLPMRQFDVKAASLYSPLKEELYIKTPEGSNRKAPFLKLKKSLYGLKQAPANWYETLTSWFNEIFFTQSSADPCLFIHNDRKTFIFFHVDDLLVVGEVDSFKELFLKRFPNSSAHSPDTLLGMELQTEEEAIKLSQRKLIEKGLTMLGMTDCKPVKTPLSVGVSLKPATEDEKLQFKALNINYCTYTGILNYLSCRTRPDLAPAVSILSSFNNDPGITHWREVIHCWKYLQGTAQLELTLRPSEEAPNSLQYYSDATVQESQWVKFVVEELWEQPLQPAEFHVDNKGLVEKVSHFGSNSKTKHLDIKLKWIRNLKDKEEIAVKLIPRELSVKGEESADQLSDTRLKPNH
ncbi:hypothetical protein PCANC_19617 [Puccinia coronata f. sp. avenae]|uniref:Reverse transcriptase Ty1/copia-type domain-containing protein n=1 Tax=Puccinia coronata f. sp. avenae TaxID=200324 RepID=A0A2N5U0U9_9BASI|nr:hypothetical protein PCANC_19617 [Puccinia coronata f. sp. avenae]